MKRTTKEMSVYAYSKICGVTTGAIFYRIKKGRIILNSNKQVPTGTIVLFKNEKLNTNGYTILHEEIFSIYKIENTNKNLFYIGKSGDYEGRIQGHKHGLIRGNHPCKQMQYDFNNGDNFIFSLIKKCNEEDSFLEEYSEIKKVNSSSLYNKQLSATKRQLIIRKK